MIVKHTGYTYEVSDSGDSKYGDRFFSGWFSPVYEYKTTG